MRGNTFLQRSDVTSVAADWNAILDPCNSVLMLVTSLTSVARVDGPNWYR